LEKIQWWNWPLEKVKANLEWFYGDVDAFIEHHLLTSTNERLLPVKSVCQLFSITMEENIWSILPTASRGWNFPELCCCSHR
jgi:hypothetical protein